MKRVFEEMALRKGVWGFREDAQNGIWRFNQHLLQSERRPTRSLSVMLDLEQRNPMINHWGTKAVVLS